MISKIAYNISISGKLNFPGTGLLIFLPANQVIALVHPVIK